MGLLKRTGGDKIRSDMVDMRCASCPTICVVPDNVTGVQCGKCVQRKVFVAFDERGNPKTE